MRGGRVELEAARAIALGLMSRHGLTGWELVFDRAKTRAGVCRHGDRQIGLSTELTRLHSPAQVTDTVLHEVAHALAGSRAGHGERWKAVARRIGCSASRCVPADAPRAPAPWVGTCPAGHTASRHRRPDRVVSCRACSPAFSREALLQWRWNGREVPMPPAYVAELARLQAGGGEQPAGTSSPARIPAGTRVRLGGRGQFAGLTGTVEKRGRTRYHVRTARGLVAAPFALVQPLPQPRAGQRGTGQ
jgi:predicted SprT family Zn-dependent metalloprotease